MKLHSVILIMAGMVVAQKNRVIDTRELTTSGNSKQLVCYWGTWANYRSDNGEFTPESIDGSLCTHLIYSFVGLDADTSNIKSLDPWMDLEENYALGGFKKATDLKFSFPKLKVSLAIGGWNEGSEKYSKMAKDPQKRSAFVESTVSFLKKYNFDGLDLDWEYPANRGGIPEDKDNFVLLVKELRAAFDKHNFLLTAAIGAASQTIETAYDIPKLYKYLDYVHVMCYDYHGKWDLKTGHNAPLFSRPDEQGNDLFLNIKYTIDFLVKRGASLDKTVLGIPFYGRAYHLENPHDNKMGAKSAETSFQGPYTREDGFMGYNEICEELNAPNNGWEVIWEPNHMAPYMVKGIKWVSYDNEESVRVKTQFALDEGLAGVMTWSIDTDDFTGSCNGIRFPLLHTIYDTLFENQTSYDSAADQTSYDSATDQTSYDSAADQTSYDSATDQTSYDSAAGCSQPTLLVLVALALLSVVIGF